MSVFVPTHMTGRGWGMQCLWRQHWLDSVLVYKLYTALIYSVYPVLR